MSVDIMGNDEKITLVITGGSDTLSTPASDKATNEYSDEISGIIMDIPVIE